MLVLQEIFCLSFYPLIYVKDEGTCRRVVSLHLQTVHVRTSII